MFCAEYKAAKDITLGDAILKKGATITCTTGNKEVFAIWSKYGIYDLPSEYVGHVIRIISYN